MPVTTESLLTISVLLAAFYMAWSIGANDVANAMGTSVGSGALTLRQAILIAAILEFSGAFFFGSHVSETVQKGLVDATIFSKDPITLVYGMLAALLSTGLWLQIASYYGWPVSTTHAIVGAVVGFGAIIGGLDAIYWGNIAFVTCSWVISPLCGGIFSYGIFMLLRKKIFYTSNPVESAKKMIPWFAFAVMGIFSLILVYKGLENLHLALTFFQALLLSLAVGLVGYCISKWCVTRMIPIHSHQKAQSAYSPVITFELEKAKKHLSRIQSSTSGDINYQVSLLLEEIKSLSETMQKNFDPSVQRSEFASVEKIFGYLQIMTACLMAFAHGANDVANAIGPLSAAMEVLRTGMISDTAAVPTWALGLGGVGIVVGLATWGWRVIETIGKKITELTPTRGFAAEFGAATTILFASRLGMPISTTHTLVGSVVGVGLARGIEALDLRMTRDIVISWVVTVPAGAIITVIFYFIIEKLFKA